MAIQPLSKYVDGLSARESRHARRLARGRDEDAAKADAKRRDGYCRWPRCACRTQPKQPLDGAHLDGKGMGGTPDGRRNDPRNIVALCRERHTGRISLHKGDLKIEKLTPDGADGPLAFYQRDELGRWFAVAVEIEPRILERD